MGVKYSGASISAQSAGPKAMLPSMSLKASIMATAATPNVAQRSSTALDNVAVERVLTVETRSFSLKRYVSLSSLSPAPNDSISSMPRNVSIKRLASSRYALYWRLARSRACRPRRTMKSTITGNTTVRIIPLTRSVRKTNTRSGSEIATIPIIFGGMMRR